MKTPHFIDTVTVQGYITAIRGKISLIICRSATATIQIYIKIVLKLF